MKSLRVTASGFATATGWLLALAAQGAERPDALPFPGTPARAVSGTDMTRIYEEVKTPWKYGVVLRGAENELVDGPKVFRRDGRWHMIYVSFRDKIGYETHLARSDDLLHWEKLGRILPFRGEGWDAWQGNGAPALVDYRWEGSHEIESWEGKYWMSYVGGEKKGYETDPLSIGLASTADPSVAAEWQRLPGNPILSGAQRDARPFESTTLYTSTIIRLDPALLGWPFVIFYNGKSPPDGHEAIGMAVSRDLREWRRLGDRPVIDNHGESRWAISGNPQIVRIGGIWVMFYFGAFWKPGAFDTFACSHDLVRWTKWDGPHLVEPGEPFDEKFAHKPWVLKHDGVVYHFYCAVGRQGRVIALATSKDFRRPAP
jgi:predicted GH43/DUF377 family glycosyl hydrolase